MGGVCTGGTIKHSASTSPDFQQKSDIHFSGKLKSIKSSSGKQIDRKKERPAYDDDDVDVDVDSSYSSLPDVEKKKRRFHHIFDSGELHFSISRELKSSSTPVRNSAAKVYVCRCVA